MRSILLVLLMTVTASASPARDQIYRAGTLPSGRLTDDQVTQVLSAAPWVQPNSAKKTTMTDSWSYVFGPKEVVVTSHDVDQLRTMTYAWKVVRGAVQIEKLVFTLAACRGIRDHVCLVPKADR